MAAEIHVNIKMIIVLNKAHVGRTITHIVGRPAAVLPLDFMAR